MSVTSISGKIAPGCALATLPKSWRRCAISSSRSFTAPAPLKLPPRGVPSPTILDKLSPCCLPKEVLRNNSQALSNQLCTILESSPIWVNGGNSQFLDTLLAYNDRTEGIFEREQ